MQNSDKLIKGKSLLAGVVGDFAYVNRNNEIFYFRLRSWLAAVLRIFSAASVTSELYGHTRFILFAIILRRGMKAYTSEKLDLSFRARPNPNRQDLDESVRTLVCKPNNYWK